MYLWGTVCLISIGVLSLAPQNAPHQSINTQVPTCLLGKHDSSCKETRLIFLPFPGIEPGTSSMWNEIIAYQAMGHLLVNSAKNVLLTVLGVRSRIVSSILARFLALFHKNLACFNSF